MGCAHQQGQCLRFTIELTNHLKNFVALNTNQEDQIMGQVASAPVMSPVNRSTAIDGFVPQRDLWVELRHPPTPYAEAMALLVCEVEADAWVAWVPGFGELLVNRSAFHRMGESV
jgi:hypothetical protein